MRMKTGSPHAISAADNRRGNVRRISATEGAERSVNSRTPNTASPAKQAAATSRAIMRRILRYVPSGTRWRNYARGSGRLCGKVGPSYWRLKRGDERLDGRAVRV